jgi:hypothetical protein
VELVSVNGEALQLGVPRTHQKARATAEKLAKFLDLGVRDESSKQIVEREAGTLDEAIKDRLQRTGEVVSPPKPLTTSRSKIQAEGDKVEIDLPASGLSPLTLMLGAAFLGMTVFVTIFFLGPALEMLSPQDGQDRPPLFFAVIWCSLIGLFLAAIWVPWLKSAKAAFAETRVAVSDDVFRLESKTWTGTTAEEIALDRLEELEIVSLMGATGVGFLGGSVLAARSDDKSLVFGSGLSPEELQWIRNAIYFTISKSKV